MSPVGVIKIQMKSELLTSITEYIYLFHMPVFVAVSGSLYYYLKRELNKYKNTKRYVINKFERLLVPYFFIAIFALLPTLYVLGLQNNIGYYLIKNILLLAGPNHLWYLVMIFNIFIIFDYFENAFFVNNFFSIFTFLLILNIFSHKLPSIFQINGTFEYFVFFYFGYYIQMKFNYLKEILQNKFSLIISFIGTIVIYCLCNNVSENMIIIIILKKFVAILGIIMIYSLSLEINKRITNNIFEKFSDYSFGIYLLHPIIIYIIYHLIRNNIFNVYITVVIIFIVTFFTSIFVINLLRKINLGYLIGDKKY